MPPQQKKLKPQKKKSLDPPIKILSLHGNGDTIRIGREIQCLPYAGFYCYSMTENE